ncbi:arylamine N-acetyltransferase family protein [Actinocorallia sp. A-T 12471]|uniref:arylamine N-acetyltransferase family protein n=1 Tax=Actinocorallia sp. A-T 12471 TaxID=3089813 RepID=UPI0029CD69CF|nr:arylamine N-acetyltransferase [Actinocorallia sp. A-T 12471]MDX6741595.1 arylamine N-acetyltransferase [Actinocorallia sp. A-T 12471]
MTRSARPAWVAPYLARLGVDAPGAPTLDALRALHRAHVERLPYETLDIQMGVATSVDRREAVRRVLAGRGGYCVQLNTAFGALLSALGYQVTGHRAGIQGRGATAPSDAGFAPHLTLTTRLDGDAWLVDAGLGDGLYEPVRLAQGPVEHGPLRFTLLPSRVEPGGWRLEHDPRGSITAMDVRPAPAANDEFAAWHPYLATSPNSRLVRAVCVMRRDASGADVLMGCVLRRIDAAGRSTRELPTAAAWYEALADVFGLRLAEISPQRRETLWEKVRKAHEEWLSAAPKMPVDEQLTTM